MLDVVVECALHEAVSAQLLLYMPSKTCFRLEFYGFKILDILRVKEHVADSGFLLVYT